MKLISTCFLLFFIYSILGWIIEVLGKLITMRKFINRGFLIGPYCPIYGVGALCITLLLQDYKNDPFTLFIMTVIICSILEYSTSYLLEKIFKTRWWDYTSYRFNINGRICLETMIPFGLFGLFIMYITNPFFLSLIQNISNGILYTITIFLFFIFIFDCCISLNIMASIKNISSNIRTDSTEKITIQVKKEIMKRNKKLQKRLIIAFPKLKVLHSRSIARKKKWEKWKKNKLKTLKKKNKF